MKNNYFLFMTFFLILSIGGVLYAVFIKEVDYIATFLLVFPTALLGYYRGKFESSTKGK